MVNDLKSQLRRDEGLSLKAYRDTLGNWTIGFGHKLGDHPVPSVISAEEADRLLDEDIERASRALLSRFTWAWKLDPIRLAVLINMAFNLGVGGLCEFKQTLEMLKHRDYAAASIEMLNSLWAKQVGERALRLSRQMQEGTWQ